MLAQVLIEVSPGYKKEQEKKKADKENALRKDEFRKKVIHCGQNQTGYSNSLDDTHAQIKDGNSRAEIIEIIIIEADLEHNRDKKNSKPDIELIVLLLWQEPLIGQRYGTPYAQKDQAALPNKEEEISDRVVLIENLKHERSLYVVDTVLTIDKPLIYMIIYALTEWYIFPVLKLQSHLQSL